MHIVWALRFLVCGYLLFRVSCLCEQYSTYFVYAGRICKPRNLESGIWNLGCMDLFSLMGMQNEMR